MAKGIENRARSPPAVFDFATSQIQKHGGTKMYYDLVESGKRIKALRKEHGLTQEQLAEQLGVAANTIARIETGNRGISIDLAIELVVRFETSPLSQGSVANMGHIDFWTDCLIPFWQSVIT